MVFGQEKAFATRSRATMTVWRVSLDETAEEFCEESENEKGPNYRKLSEQEVIPYWQRPIFGGVLAAVCEETCCVHDLMFVYRCQL